MTGPDPSLFDHLGPLLLRGLAVSAWLLPFPAAIAGWIALRDLPRARRRYRSSAIAICSAYAAVVGSGAVVALTVGRDTPALAVGSCCLFAAGPLVALLLLIRPSMLRAGHGATDADAADAPLEPLEPLDR